MRIPVYSIFLSTVVFSVFAGGSADSTLTLTGAVNHAVAHGLSMRTARNQQQAVQYDLIAARNALLPSASASLGASGLLDPDRQASAGASIGVDYSFSPADFASVRAGIGSSKATAADLEQLRKDVAAEVIIQFVSAVGTLKLIEVEEANIAYQTEKTAEVEALFQAGKNARSDLLQQRSNLAEARARYLTAAQNHLREKLALLDLLDLPLRTGRYQLDTASVMRLCIMCAGYPPEHDFSGLPETDDITAQRFRVAASESNLAAARLSYVPDLSLSAGWSADDILYSTVTGKSGDVSTSLRVGASVGIPLFDRRQRWLKVKNAENSVQSALLALEKLQQSNDLTVARAALDDAMAQEQIAVDSVRCEAAKEALDAVEERYRAGASTLIDLNEVRTTWLEARSDFVLARFDRVESTVTLLYRTGRFDRVVELLGQSSGTGNTVVPENKGSDDE